MNSTPTLASPQTQAAERLEPAAIEGRPRPDVQPAFRHISYPEQVGKAKAELFVAAPALRRRVQAHPNDYILALTFRSVMEALRALNQTPGSMPFPGDAECPDCLATSRMLGGACVFCGFECSLEGGAL